MPLSWQQKPQQDGSFLRIECVVTQFFRETSRLLRRRANGAAINYRVSNPLCTSVTTMMVVLRAYCWTFRHEMRLHR
jgi:hypothetical protein